MPPPKNARRLKWLKKPAYGERMSRESREAGLSRSEMVRRSGWSLAQIKRLRSGHHISFRSHQHILEVINKARDQKGLAALDIDYPWGLDGPTERDNWDAEKIFQAFSRTTVYTGSIQQAEEMFKRCYRAKQFLASAHWADHAAGEYRKQGQLKSALNCLDDCFRALGKVTKAEKASVEMRLISLRAHFEGAMTREYEAHGQFRAALTIFGRLDTAVDELQNLPVPRELQGELGLRKIHHKRQRAEMHRLLGEYGTALCLMEEAIAEYPEWADEPRRFGRLHRADSLRLLDRAEEALAEYERLEATARNRHLDGFLAGVLWPKVGACQGLSEGRKRETELDRTLGALRELVTREGNGSKYFFIYSRLVQVSSVVSNREAADSLVNEALQAGPLEPDCYRTEYAHALLCRGEIERGQKNFAQAKGAYREALQYYELMEMRWGIVRATVGLNLAGQKRELPGGLGFQGCDAAIWTHFKKSGKFAPGMLCENLP